MIPKIMEKFLRERLPVSTWENRLVKQKGMCFIEFNSLDIERLARMDIEVDQLGPRLVVCMWNEESPLEIGGYLVVDNLAMGQPSMGGIRMLPDIDPSAIHNLARGMTLKNAAADLPYGGGKSGIVSERLSSKQHQEIIKGFAKLIYRYHDIYLPGPDVGTCDDDMKTIAIENGLDSVVSKPLEMGGNRIDELGAAAGSAIIALQALLGEMHKLRALPQFKNVQVPNFKELTVLIQGFGAVGAHAARIINERLPGAKVIGISDVDGYIFNKNGLPISKLFEIWKENGLVTKIFFNELSNQDEIKLGEFKYSTCSDDLLRESAFCLIPASPISNYLDVDNSTSPCITTRWMGDWTVIIEGANTYSPIESRKNARARMEREVYRREGVLIGTDYLVNSGGVIYAAQERLIKTPEHLRIPERLLGKSDPVENWLDKNSSEYCNLAEIRRKAAFENREEVIRRNMKELVDLLISDADMLPCEAAEKISIRRVTSRESDRTAEEIMAPIPTITIDKTVKDAAEKLIKSNRSILAVTSTESNLVGIVTDWDITRATSLGNPDDQPLEEIMITDVISVSPDENILDLIRKLEYHEISAMPVIKDGCVLGVVSSDLLARKSLLRLLQSSLE
jgi:glutamate dehydrogenase/leucine dehydrogenase/CBS domain-containing protein